MFHFTTKENMTDLRKYPITCSGRQYGHRLNPQHECSHVPTWLYKISTIIIQPWLAIEKTERKGEYNNKLLKYNNFHWCQGIISSTPTRNSSSQKHFMQLYEVSISQQLYQKTHTTLVKTRRPTTLDIEMHFIIPCS